MTDAPQLRRNPTTGQVFIYEPGQTEWREVQARRNEETGEVFVFGQGDTDWRSIGPLPARDQGGARLPSAEAPAPQAPRTAPQRPALDPALMSALTGAPATPQMAVPAMSQPPAMPGPSMPAPGARPAATGNPLVDAMMPQPATPQMPAVSADRAAMIAQTMGAGVDPRTVPMPGVPQAPRQPEPERVPQPAADLGRRVAMGAVEPFASIPEFGAILSQDIVRSRYGSALDAVPALEQEATQLRQIIATADDSTEGAMRRGAAEMRLRNVEGELTRALRMVEQDTADLARNPTAESRWLFALGDRLRNAVSGTVGETDPQFDDRFASQLAYGGGNMTGMMVTALLGGPVVGSGLVAGQGASMNTSQVYQEALASGASEEDALLAARFAGVIGSSEIIPIQRALDVLPARLRNAVAGRVSRHIANIMQSSGEEAAQEALAQVANNILASSIYDPERGWSEGVTEAAAVGAVLGGATGALGTAINRPGQGVDPVTAGGEENRGGEPPRDVPPTPQATPTPPADPATALLDAMAPRTPPVDAATPVPPPEPETPRLPESAPVGQAGQRPAVPTPPPAEERPAVGAGRAPVAGEGLDPAEWNVIPGVDAQGNETGRTFMENSRTGEVIPRAEYERRLGQQAEAQAPAAEPAPPPAQPPAADPVAQAMAGETEPSAPDAGGNALVQALTPAPAPAPTGMTIDVGGRQYPVDSYEMASRMVRQAIERGDFGASDMDGTPLIRDAQGNVVARVAYNGRVFPGAEYQAGVAPLYDPLSREDKAAIAGGPRAVEPPQPGRPPAPPVGDAQTPEQAGTINVPDQFGWEGLSSDQRRTLINRAGLVGGVEPTEAWDNISDENRVEINAAAQRSVENGDLRPPTNQQMLQAAQDSGRLEIVDGSARDRERMQAREDAMQEEAEAALPEGYALEAFQIGNPPDVLHKATVRHDASGNLGRGQGDTPTDTVEAAVQNERRTRLEGDETEARRQGRADFAADMPRRLPPYIDPTDSVASMGWYTGWDEANLAQEVPGVQPARDLPDLAPRDRRKAWNGMSPAQRETLLRSMGGFDKRDGSLTGGGKNAIQKNWQDLSAGAREKIETAWRDMEDAETFAAPQDTTEGGDRDAEVQGQGREEAVDAAPASPPSPAGPVAEDRQPDAGPAQPEPAGEAAGDGETETTAGEAEPAATVRLGRRIARMLADGERIASNQALMTMAAEEFGGTIGQGAFGPKDAYEALELGVNLTIQRLAREQDVYDPSTDLQQNARAHALGLAQMLDALPTQTRRDMEQEAFQQFSTPPAYAYAVNWIANIPEGARVLEPSAGNGGIAVFAGNVPRTRVDVNELSERRVPSLEALGFDRVSTENAEQIGNIWANDPTRRYDVVVMNPPFSASGTRGTANTSAIGARHIEQALALLKPGGRLVAIMGHTFRPSNSRVKPFFDKLGRTATLRANVEVNGNEVYRKYGTSYDSRVLVIDKIPQEGDAAPVTGRAESIADLIRMLEDVRNDTRYTAGKAATVDPAGADADGAGGRAPAEPGRRDGRPTREPEQSSEPDDLGGEAAGGRGNRRPAAADGSDTRPAGDAAGGPRQGERGRADGADGAAGSSGRAAGDSGRPTVRVRDAEETRVEDTAGGFAKYRPTRVRIEGAKEHPMLLVESSAMASVNPPKPDYELKLPAKMVKDGLLSEAQLETVVYAGAAHSEMLPADGDRPAKRKGFFIGDGTGVGKTREIAGIIADNWAQGRTKHILISKDKKLLKSARRDFDNVGMKSVPLADLGGVKPTGAIPRGTDGVMFATYNTLAREGKGDQKSRIDQLVEWVGADFEGTIIFDEAHLAGNAVPIKGKRGTSKPSKTALAVVDLQRALPNARVVYASATGATEVYNLAYADRLGLWGPGTPFPNVMSFVSQIDAGGIAAMEVVARDMKQMGVYMARSLSFEGVEYAKVEHELTGPQRQMYDAAAQAWQRILSNVAQVIQDRTEGGSRQRAAAMAQFWGSHQRFFQQVLTSMQMPTVIRSIKADLAAGRAPVIQIVNTNEAATNRAIGALEEGDTLDDIDITPREDIMQYLQNSFPIQQWEEYADEDGNVRTRPVVDSKGNPVFNAEAMALRDQLIEEIAAMQLPGNPLDLILETFGAENVAEVTGRSKRIVTKNGKKVQESRSQSKTLAEAAEFMAGKREVLIFSDAGGTGMDFHADKGVKNKARRAHYVLQAGWRADRAIQGFGRTHRTNQTEPPIYKLAGTNLSGHKRFTSSIARRLDQLGALTKGQSDTGGGGMFSATDNLENVYAENAVMALMREVYAGNLEGWGPAQLETELGLQLAGEQGFSVSKVPPVPQFLNRLLNTTIDRQNQLFDRFIYHMEAAIETAIERGEFTAGIEQILHDGAALVETKEAYRAQDNAAVSEYQMIRVRKRTQVTPFREHAKLASTTWKRDRDTGTVYAFRPSSTRTAENGDVIPTYSRWSPTDRTIIDSPQYRMNYEVIDADAAEAEWQRQIDEAPPFRESNIHMVTGALLPIWDRLPKSSPKIVRITLDDGRTLLGRQIPDNELVSTMERLGVGAPQIDMSAAEVLEAVMGGRTVHLSSGHRIARRRVGGEARIEIIPDQTAYEDTRPGGTFQRAGFQIERIGYKARAFIPNSEVGAKVLQSYMQGKSIINVTMERQQARLDMFYSPLLAGLDGAKQARAPAQDWKAIIAKLPGVKRAEIEWMGVEDWLDLQEGQVTREALADFVREQQIHISEVIRTDEPDDMSNGGWGQTGGTSFESYTEDGGTNYREMLLTVPNLHEAGPNRVKLTAEQQRRWDDVNARIRATLDDRGMPPMPNTAGFGAWNRLTDERESLAAEFGYGKEPFVQASHFSEPNIVVHARVKDRTGPNGERVLFVEEIQSDLASKWREATESPEVTARRQDLVLEEESLNLIDIPKLRAAVLDRAQEIAKRPAFRALSWEYNQSALFIRAQVRQPMYEHSNNTAYGRLYGVLSRDEEYLRADDALQAAEARRKELREELLALGTARSIDPSTPDTPFKEEHTYTLMVKRLLREAAAQGYDRLAWTPGYMQAERWNKAGESVVNDVIWNPEPDGGDGRRVRLVLAGYNEVAMRVDADGTIRSAISDDGGTGQMLEGKNVRAVLGTAMADRILNEPSGEKRDTRITFPDSGYAIAYDQQIKRAVDKLAKGTGARVEQTLGMPDFTNDDIMQRVRQMDPADVRRRLIASGAISEIQADLAESSAGASHPGPGYLHRAFVQNRDAQIAQALPEASRPVWSITITDDLRKKAMLPQPILQQGRQRVTQGPYAPYRETMAESRVFKTLRAELDRLGLKNVELQFDPFFEHQGSVYADHFGRVAITIGNTLNPRWTMGHEAIHVYKHMGVFTREEWALLSETAEAEWMDRYGIAARYPDLTREEQIEEAVAEAFGEVYDNRSNAFISEPLVLQALRKVANFLRAIRNWARGMGMQTSGDIINALARGAYARKAQVNARPAGWQSQTDRLLRHQRKPGMLQQNRGALHLPDRRVWETLFEANDLSIRERLRETRGALRDRADAFRTRIQDRMLPMRRALEEVERVMGAPMPEDLNVYLAEEMYSGRAGHKLDIIEQQYVEPIMDLIGKTKGVTAETVGRYLYARHAVERNERIAQINPDMPDGGSGMSSEEAAMILAEIEGSDAAPAYREIAKKIDALREWSIQLRVDAGLMTEYQANAWRAAYKTYVPLKGWAETENADAEFDVTGIGRGYNVRGQESRMAMGRRTEAFNPLIAALTQAQEAVVRSEKNLVGQHLYRLAKDLPSKNLWTVKRAETRRVFNETTGLVEERAFSPITLLQAQNEFAVKIDGEEHRVMLHDPRLARSMGLVGTDAMIGPIRILSHFSRYFSTMNTMLNPTFLPKNVMRDMLTATINVRRFPNSARIQRRMLRDWPKALAGAYRGLGGKSDTKWAQYFREFSEAGGKVSFWVIENPESSQARLERMARRRSGPLGMAASFATWRISENPALAAIERINLAADNAVRLSAFVAAREEGYTIQEAASLAKNLTVNFNRRGEWGSVINAFYTFSNAGFQGTHMILKSLKDSAYARRAALALVAIGFLLDQANSYLSDEDEDGQLYYDKIPDYTHAMNAVLMLGTGPDTADTSIRLFLPYGYNVFPYIGNRLSRLQRGVTNERNVIGDIALTTFTSFSPISGGDFLSTISPTIASPFVEMATNRNFFGGPIYPQYQQPGLPDSQFHTQGATRAAVLTADMLNRWTGGTYAESGYIDVSPDSIDHIAGFLGGGAGRFIGRSANFVALATNDTPGDVTTNDVPFLRDVYVPPQGWWSTSLYWDRRRELEAAHNQARNYEAAGDPVPDSIRWRADLWRNDSVRLEAHRIYNGTVGRTQDQERAVLLLNSAYIRAMARNTPYNGESIFDALRP